MDEAEEAPYLEQSDPVEELAPRSCRAFPPPAANACCERCGSADVSVLPYFSAGSGTGLRPQADDVYCRRCGHMGPPAYI